MGVTAGVPPRVEAGMKSALLDLVDGAVEAGWTTARACAVLELDGRRCRRWQHRRGAGRLDDHTAGGTAVHAITPFECRAVLELFERWGDIDGGYRKLAHRGSYENLVWVSPSTLYRVLAGEGLVLPARPQRTPVPARPLPDWIEWKRHQIWIYDITHFPRAGRVAYAILDVVTRKWLATLVTAEETATQVEVVFTEALDSEGPVARRRGPPSRPSPPRRRQRRRADPAGHVRQRPPDASRHHQRVLGPLLHRGPLRPARHPRRTRHGSRPCSATSKPNGPTSRRSPTPTRCEPNSTSPDATTTPDACTPPSATSPPTTNTKDAATPSARPAKTASTGPASPASPTIATTNQTSHEHTRPMRRNQTPQNGHLLRSTSRIAQTKRATILIHRRHRHRIHAQLSKPIVGKHPSQPIGQTANLTLGDRNRAPNIAQQRQIHRISNATLPRREPHHHRRRRDRSLTVAHRRRRGNSPALNGGRFPGISRASRGNKNHRHDHADNATTHHPTPHRRLTAPTQRPTTEG